MLINFHINDLVSVMRSADLSPHQIRSTKGMLLGRGRIDAVLFLEKNGIVRIDRDHHCKCGVCDPEWLVNLIKSR
jgi:hypothetical protein